MSPGEDRRAEPVAVTGMGVVCSVASGVEAFATALRSGASGIEAAPFGADGPPYGARIRAFSLDGALGRRRDLPDRLLLAAERAVRRAPFPLQVATACALEAWEHASLHRASVPGDRLGLIVAGNNLTGRYVERLRATYERDPAYLPARFALHVQDTDHVGTLSEILAITGEGFTVGGASASGNLAIIHGCRLLALGALDACLVVGPLVELSDMETRAFLNLGAMAGQLSDRAAQPPGPPFDVARRGFVPGQGCATLVLEAASSAARRGRTVLAWVGGHAGKLDGHRLAEPSEQGEAAVMTAALGRAGLEPHQTTYVNSHGSGSLLGDKTEAAALRRVFGSAARQPWVNATKSVTGHCLAAAGVLEAVATVIQMRHAFVHPNVGLSRPIEPGCRFVGPRAIDTEIPTALSNSFGFGGINSSVLFIDARGPRRPGEERAP